MTEPRIILQHDPATHVKDAAADALSRSLSDPRVIGFCFNGLIVYIDRETDSTASLVDKYHDESRSCDCCSKPFPDYADRVRVGSKVFCLKCRDLIAGIRK